MSEGRLWWFGRGNVNASASDAFDVFDEMIEGDSAPIDRSIGAGPVDDIKWALDLSRIIVGTQGSELSIRSSSLDEPITRANFNFRGPSTQGSGDVDAIKIDNRGMFVQRSDVRLYELSVDDRVTYDYGSLDMMALVPEIGYPVIKRLGVQRQPDTRIHCVRGDGKVAILVSEPAEEVLFWILYETDGFVEEVDVLPGPLEDRVYYTVRREVNGETVRYRERWSQENECRGGTVSRCADSHILYSGTNSDILGDLEHLEGKEVVVWGDGKDLGSYTVENGSIRLSEPASEIVVGLKYTAQFKSAKLQYAAAAGTALTQKKTFAHVGLVLADTHWQGLRFGLSFDDDQLEDLPCIGEEEEEIEEHTVFDLTDVHKLPVEHGWTTDSRLCLEACAPRPCTVLACVIDQQTNG